MARRLRIEYEGALYHALNRGIARRALFRDEKDFSRFLENMEETAEVHRVVVHAYVLLTNHFHLLAETPEANLSGFMQALQTRYAVYFNKRHRQRGHVFQGPYKGVPVEEGRYLLKLSRYIHLNPVRTKRYANEPIRSVIEALRTYRWSSYRGYIRLSKRADWVCYKRLEGEVAAWLGKQRGGYRKYVESGLAQADDELEAALGAGSLGVGSVEFVEEMKERYRVIRERSTRRSEDISLQTERCAVPVEEILEAVCEGLCIERGELTRRRGGGSFRGVAARMLIKYGRLTQREAAEHLGVTTGAAVCIRLRECDEAMKTHGQLRRRVARIEKSLMAGRK